MYGRLLDDIFIQRDGTEGCVSISGLYGRNEGMPKLRFSISEEGNTFSWIEEAKKTPSLLSLPPSIKRAIFYPINLTLDGDGFDHGGKVTWDLDMKTVTGASPVLGAVCREFRMTYAHDFWDCNRHCIKMSTSQILTDFDNFKDLQQSWNAQQRHYVWEAFYHEERESRLELILHFNVGFHVALKDIRMSPTYCVSPQTSKAARRLPYGSLTRRPNLVQRRLSLWKDLERLHWPRSQGHPAHILNSGHGRLICQFG